MRFVCLVSLSFKQTDSITRVGGVYLSAGNQGLAGGSQMARDKASSINERRPRFQLAWNVFGGAVASRWESRLRLSRPRLCEDFEAQRVGRYCVSLTEYMKRERATIGGKSLEPVGAFSATFTITGHPAVSPETVQIQLCSMTTERQRV